MCYQVKCKSCTKTTWDGCGMHVSCAMMGVPNEERCPNWKKGARQPCQPGQKLEEEAPSSWSPLSLFAPSSAK